MFNLTIKLGIPIIGICRGSQFVTVMSGGKLVQNVENHAISGTHPLYLNDQTISIADITSTHHQMMYPFDIPHYMLFTSSKRSSFYNMNDRITLKNFMFDVEPEIVFYPDTQALAIQGHPEYMSHSTVIVQLLNAYLARMFDISYTLPKFSDVIDDQIDLYQLLLRRFGYVRTLRSIIEEQHKIKAQEEVEKPPLGKPIYYNVKARPEAADPNPNPNPIPVADGVWVNVVDFVPVQREDDIVAPF
jgi:GMP synthase-like glutamine amidotransferase